MRGPRAESAFFRKRWDLTERCDAGFLARSCSTLLAISRNSMPPEPAAKSDREFSTAFDKLVESGGSGPDMVGLLAYALYKRDKREVAATGSLDAEQLRHHHKMLTSGLLNQYRDSALRLLEDYSNEVVARAEPQIQAAARISSIEQARDAVISEVKLATAWWQSILWNVLAWLISLAIAFLVTVGTGKVSLQIGN